MNCDVLVPEGNEEALIAQAKKLGWQEIILLYPFGAKKPSVSGVGGLKIRSAVFVERPQEALSSTKNHDFVFGIANRANFECPAITHLVNAEIQDASTREGIRQKHSGLDEVLCEIASEKGKVVVFNLSLFGKNHQVMGRIQQNVRLCKKYRVLTLFASFGAKPSDIRTPKDLESFARSLELKNH